MRRVSGSSGIVFFIFLIIMVFNSIQSGRFNNPALWLYETLVCLPAIIIGLTFHEFMHAFSAWKLGDMTPKVQGRVTLNPASHIDPVGIIAIIFVGFGWGRPVQVNPYAFPKNRRLSNFIVDIAGVGMNFFIAFIFTAIYLLVVYKWGYDPGGTPCQILVKIVQINFILMVFNLLPIPPLDGFGIITEIFDLRRFEWYRPLYNNGTFILLALIVFNILGKLLYPVLNVLTGFSVAVWFGILF